VRTARIIAVLISERA